LEKVEPLGNARSLKADTRPRCVDCSHYKLYRADPVLIFSSPKHRCTAAVDLVTGKTAETDCYAMRDIRCECGPDARLFKDAPAKEDKRSPAALPPEERGMSLGSIALLVLGALAILALIYWAYAQETDQPRVIQTGKVSLNKVPAKDGTCCVTARTRLMAIGKRSLWQVEASPGDWRDCGNDCEQALRKALAK
jgi:hypothetical protein